MFENLLNKLLRRRKVTDDYVEDLYLNVWNITSGPYHRDEVEDPNVPEGLEVMLLCLVEVDGNLLHKEYWFSSYEDASVWVDHFQKKIEPIKVRY